MVSVITDALARNGHLIAIDRLPMRHSSPHLTFIHSDITDDNLPATMQTLLHNRKPMERLDLSPNTVASETRIMTHKCSCCHLALHWARLYLAEDGFLLTKVTQGLNWRRGWTN